MSFLVLTDKFLRTPDVESGTPPFLIPSEPCETNNNRFGKDLRIDWCFGVHPGVLPHSCAEILPRDVPGSSRSKTPQRRETLLLRCLRQSGASSLGAAQKPPASL
ncbi:hypothetical protein QQF64_009211 [Cirrhinus molitorella]|uniref:Uncharacterized protein n=1 Tax=Cirrhinus molitorella TaxID=172907 RepID=A0ABR3M0I4_9TELE